MSNKYGDKMNKCITLFDALTDDERIIVMHGYNSSTGKKVTIDREEFYLNTGRILTNNRELLKKLTDIERLYYFGGNPTKEEILQYVELVKEQQKVIESLTEELREHGKLKPKEDENN